MVSPQGNKAVYVRLVSKVRAAGKGMAVDGVSRSWSVARRWMSRLQVSNGAFVEALRLNVE